MTQEVFIITVINKKITGGPQEVTRSMLRTLNDIGGETSLSLSYVTKLTNQGIPPEPTSQLNQLN